MRAVTPTDQVWDLQAQIPITIERIGYSGVIALSWSVITIDELPDISISAPMEVAPGATTATATARYTYGPVAPNSRVVVTATADGVSRSGMVRVRNDSLIPRAPRNLTARTTTTSVTLSWEADHGATSYRIERAPTETSTFVLWATVDSTVLSYTDLVVQPETRYVYRVYAVNEHGTSPPAEVDAVTTRLPVLTVIVHGLGSVRSEPAGIDCGTTCTLPFPDGTVVRLTATPAPGHTTGGFVGGDADCSDGVVTMRQNVSCLIQFGPVTGSGWQDLTPPLTATSAVVPSFSLAIEPDVTRNLVVAYVESSPPSDPARLYVKRRNGAVWQTLGSGALNAGSPMAATDPSLASRSATPLHVAWSQGNGFQQDIFVARFNGTTWESVGTMPLNYVAGTRAVRPSLALDTATGMPMVAWIENGFVKFKRFNGSNWVAASGGEGPPSGNADRVELSLFDSAGPAIAWTEGVGGARALKVTSGLGFTPLGTQVNAPLAVGRSLTDFGVRAGQAGPLVTWAESPSPFSIFSKRWDGAQWVDEASPVVANVMQSFVSFAMSRSSDNGSGSRLAFSSRPPGGGSQSVQLRLLTGGTWFDNPQLNPSLTGPTLQNIQVLERDSQRPVIAGWYARAADLYELRVLQFF
jgi:hypothetical protein